MSNCWLLVTFITIFSVNLLISIETSYGSREISGLYTPSTTITARKTAGGLLKPQFTSASFILKEKLDNLMEQFRVSDSEFYNEYWNARETVDYGTRHEKIDKKAE